MIRKRTVQFLLALLFLFAGQLHAADFPPTPTTLDGVEIVDADYMFQAMESEAALIVDARKPHAFKSAHIPGAVFCAPHSSKADLGANEVDAAVAFMHSCGEVMQADRGKEAIVYCASARCWRSPKAALALKKIGFTNVKWLRDGMKSWEKNEFPVE
uniref:Rhodanese domain-containing protein n=1 Tax=Magnetococcus massalia (strain MO-1) TaxID=451514 RepID=A0A1S7LMB2_MAGMO|nr:conserved protein of unknown function. putative Rhodanese domain protein [Candidatus Magnetococcus massalia]